MLNIYGIMIAIFETTQECHIFSDVEQRYLRNIRPRPRIPVLPLLKQKHLQDWEIFNMHFFQTNLNFSTGSLVFSIAFFAFSTIINSFRSPAVFGRDIVGSNKILNSETRRLLETNG